MSQHAQVSKFEIQPLCANHDRAAFSCGVEALDSYLWRQAGQDLKKYAAVPFVATDDGKTIAGYYTLSQFAVAVDEVPLHAAKKLPKYPMVPTTLLGRLAVSLDFRGRGIGEFLLMDALHRSLESSRQVASSAVIVDAKDESALNFYKKYGLLELPHVKNRLFLAMGTIKQMFEEA